MNTTKRDIIVAAIVILALFGIMKGAEAGPYGELGAGKNANVFGHSPGLAWDDADGAIGAHIAAGYTFHHTDQWSTSIHWTHVSHWNAGWPIDHRAESTVDHIGVKVRYELWR